MKRTAFLYPFLCVLAAVEAFAPPAVLRSTPLTVRSAGTAAEYDGKIDAANDLLYKAADTKAEDPDLVFEALSDLEKLMR